ncbi:MAG: phage/plasmid primase, P4 family [Vagococcus sp.]|uniref:DNA primase family protein n=1 Tax=Vagococcus sp. TaxID=1933889 RepID=UPI002FCBDA02
MMQSLKVLDQQFNSKVKQKEITQPSVLYGKKLKATLIEKRQLLLAEAEEKYILNGSKGTKPTKLHPLQVAIELKEFVAFKKLGTANYSNLAMYQAQKGTYTINEDDIYMVMSWLEPTLNERLSRDVLFHLKKGLELTEQTNDENLAPVKNGIYNRKTKKLMPFSEDYVFLSTTDTKYNEKANNPKIKTNYGTFDIEEWLYDLSNHDEEVYTLLWQVISDVVNPNISRRKSIWLYGERGNNGKGTFQELITNLVGLDNVASLKVKQFNERFALSNLIGTMCCIGDDNNPNEYVDDVSNYKSAITGDTLLMEVKHKQSFSDVYKGTIIQSMNGYPRVKDTTDGFNRRILIVPFLKSFNPSNDDWRIKDEYIKNRRIREYVLKKALNLDFERFIEPKVSKQALSEFKEENDTVLEFYMDDFQALESARIPNVFIHHLYNDVASRKSNKELGRTAFMRRFKVIAEKDGWISKPYKIAYYFKENEERMFEQLNSQDYLEYLKGKKANSVVRCFSNEQREHLFDIERYNNQLKEYDDLVIKIEKSFNQAKETGKADAIFTEESYQEAIRLRDEAYVWLHDNKII